METTVMGYIGYTLGLYWGMLRYVGIMEIKMETTIFMQGLRVLGFKGLWFIG